MNGQEKHGREAARKAFRREYHEVWSQIAGDAAKIKRARAILARCDRIRDQLVAQYGRRREALIAKETARLLAENTGTSPEFTPDGAAVARRDIENEAIRRVADRQRAKLRSLNDRERRMIYRRVLSREPEPRAKTIPSRGYRTSEKNARILNAVDRAKTLRERAREYFANTRQERLTRAAEAGVERPAEAVSLAEAKRLRWIDRAERNTISKAMGSQVFNRAARSPSTPSMAG
jgi:hypothetical protein